MFEPQQPLPGAEAVQETAAERIARHSALLKEMAEMGMEVARVLRDEAVKGEDSVVADRFTRVIRAVRQTLALETKLTLDHELQLEAHKAKLAARQTDQADGWNAASALRLGRRNDVRRVAMRTVRTGAAASDHERLLGDLDEYLDLPMDYDRPVSELVAEICSALGVEPDWKAWRTAEWGQDEALNGPPDTPFTRWDAKRSPSPSPSWGGTADEVGRVGKPHRPDKANPSPPLT